MIGRPGGERVDETRAEGVARLDAAGIERHGRVGVGEPRAPLVVRDPVDDLDRVLDAERARALGDEGGARDGGHAAESGLRRAPQLGGHVRAAGPRACATASTSQTGSSQSHRPSRPDEVQQPRGRSCAATGASRPAVGPNGTVRKRPSSLGSLSISSGSERAAREHHPERQVALALVRAEHEVGRGQEPALEQRRPRRRAPAAALGASG